MITEITKIIIILYKFNDNHQYRPTGSWWVQRGRSRALCLLWKVVVTTIMIVAMMVLSFVFWGRWWELSWWHCRDFRHLYVTEMKAFDICCHFCGFSCICVTVVSNDSYVWTWSAEILRANEWGGSPASRQSGQRLEASQIPAPLCCHPHNLHKINSRSYFKLYRKS